MGSKTIFLGYSLFVAVVIGFVLSGSCQAYNFYVGGKDGWVLNPSENYSHWAGRNRFQVNDTLLFKYKKGSDSVLIVSKEDYYSCSSKNPVQSLTDGNSTFKFDHSGPFFFISGMPDNCNKGQKLIIVVMAVRPKTPSPAPLAAPPQSPSPQSGNSPLPMPPASNPASDSENTAPPPSKSGSAGFTAPAGLLLVATIAVNIVLGGFVGML
ncbi:hypothetical protein Tsubulata_005729 [Turnera subulata]|uniref:Phytocyanin domain-containing protein n=1 Tax=Turnera subulata TaxID=218843 RepID=A0A9Q0G8L1_9ROSI|nr:hypothetical protein Tsubulata_005729 [Turnera subulata]